MIPYASGECFVAIALEAHDNDVTLEDHSVQLYAPVTSAGQTTQTATNRRFLGEFQQFCKVCSSSFTAGLCVRQVACRPSQVGWPRRRKLTGSDWQGHIDPRLHLEFKYYPSSPDWRISA